MSRLIDLLAAATVALAVMTGAVGMLLWTALLQSWLGVAP